MMLTSPEPRCPDSVSWLRLLEEDVSALERDELECHLESCDPCRDTFVGLAGEGSLRITRGTVGDAPVGQATLDILTRLVRRQESRAVVLPSELEPGRIPEIPGFADFEAVGRGGMGIVFRARQVALDRTVAIKILSAAGSLDRTARARAVREAMTLARLRHPNILSIHGSGEVDGLPYLVAEWVDGGTLQQRLDAGTFGPREAAAMVRTLAGAVGVAHAMGIIHRDLKPANVLLSLVEGGDSIPKLADFGLARSRGQDHELTETGMVIGTPNYMAPEQTGLARSCGEVGPLTDIHALGAILQALLTGHPPYEADSPWAILIRVARGEPDPIRSSRPDLPRDLETIVAKCLARDPARRYRSAGELADDLGRFLEGRPVTARPISRALRLAKWARRRPTAAMAVASIVLMGCIAIAGGAYHLAELRRSVARLEQEQGRTKAALDVANNARDQANKARDQANRADDKKRRALATLTDGAVERMIARGSVLNDEDLAFLRKLRGHYEEPDDGDQREELKSLDNRAEGLAKLGQLFGQIGRPYDCILSLEAAISIRDEAARRAPDEASSAIQAIEARQALAYVLHQNGRNVEALPWTLESVAASRRLVARWPEKASILIQSQMHHALMLGAAGKGIEADRVYQDVEQAMRRFKADRPGDSWISIFEFSSHFNRAMNLRNIGQMDLSEQTYEAALVVAEECQSRSRGTADGLGWELLVLDRMISSRRARGRPAEALEIQARRFATVGRLASLSPNRERVLDFRPRPTSTPGTSTTS